MSSYVLPDEIDAMDSFCLFEPVSAKMKTECYNRAFKRMNIAAAKRQCCSVCDCDWPIEKIKRLDTVGRAEAKMWVQKLSPNSEVPDKLKKHYDVSKWFPNLKGAIMSASGVEKGPVPTLLVCEVCMKGLRRESGNPPKFAVANGFDIGLLPSNLTDISMIEKRMTSVTCIAAPVTTIRGGKHKHLHGHVHVVTMDPTTISKRLPQILSSEEEKFLVVIAGKLTPVQEIVAMRRQLCRHSKVQQVLKFYIDHNILYQNIGVEIDESAIKEIERSNGASSLNIQRVEGDSVDVLSGAAQNWNAGGESSRERTAHQVFDPSPAGNKQTEKNSNREPKTESHCEAKSPHIETTYKETSSVYVDESAQTTVEALEMAREIILVRNHGRFVSDYDKDLFGLAFPDLFPYGRGHPGTERKVPVSLEECCSLYLRLASRKFAQHKIFSLVAFDICGRRRVVNSTLVRARNRPSDYKSFGEVSREVLADVLLKQKKERQNAMNGKKSQARVARDGNKGGIAMLRSVRVSQSHMWGSGEERLVYRRKAFPMDAFHKSGAIFVTMSLSDTGTILISILSGAVNVENVETAQNNELPDHARRIEISGIDPVACSEYFEMVCEAFISEIVRFDQKKGLPFKGGGLFGVVKAFLGAVETQRSGTLHWHSILFIAGLPRNLKEFSERCTNGVEGNAFKSRFCAMVDSVVSNSVPISSSCPAPSCPSCGDSNSLHVLPKVPREAFRRAPSHKRAVPISACDKCKKTFGGTDVLREKMSEISRTCLEGDIGRKANGAIPISSRDYDLKTEEFFSVPKGFIWEKGTDTSKDALSVEQKLNLSRLVLLTQQHNFRHVASCFKSSLASKSGECRYSFPRYSVLETSVVDNKCLQIKRMPHNEYINSYNDVLAMIFASNHDIRFLVGAGTTDAFYYCMKYVTKAQHDEELPIEKILIESYERRRKREEESRENGLPASSMVKGRARVNSMAVALSRKQEVSATLCVYYLRNKTALLSSHQFSALTLSQSMAIVERDDHEVSLVPSEDGKFVKATQYDDFLFRPKFLRHMAMVEFVSECKRECSQQIHELCSLQDSQDQKAGEWTKALFLTNHPLFKTHYLRRRSVPTIPDIIGRRLPDRESLVTKEEKETYGLIALLLTYPFHLDRPLQKNSSYWECYKQFEASGEMSKRCQSVIENLQDYHVSRRAAACERFMKAEANSEYIENDMKDADRDPEEINDSKLHAESGENLGISALSQASKGIPSRVTSEKWTFISSPGTNRYVKIAAERTKRTCLRYLSGFIRQKENLSCSLELESSSKPILGQLDKDKAVTSEDIAREYLEILNEVRERRRTGRMEGAPFIGGDVEKGGIDIQETSIEIMGDLENGISKEYEKRASAANEEKRRSEVKENISRTHGLNEYQKIAFELVAEEYLQRIQSKESIEKENSSSKPKENNRFVMYLGGEGGTGKTRVIWALQSLAVECNKLSSIRTCAPTGIAASLVNGQTFHSFFKLRGDGTFNLKRKASEVEKEEHIETELLIVDEISMLARANLAVLDIFLQKVKEKTNSLEG